MKPIALFKMEDDKGIDDKVICVPLDGPELEPLERREDLPDQLQNEIAHFFEIYKTLEDKPVKVDGWHSREDAWEVIKAAKQRYKDERGGLNAL